jgi:hypothetical protein
MASSRLWELMALTLEITVAIASSIDSSSVSVIGICIPEGKSGLSSQFLAVPIPL